MTEKGAENGHAYDDGVKRGKKATKAAAATAAAAAEANASPGKKQLPMPRAGELFPFPPLVRREMKGWDVFLFAYMKNLPVDRVHSE